MKKLMTIFGAIIFASLFLTSCGPSACRCAEIYNAYGLEFAPSETQDCIKKFGSSIPDNLRGTDEFGDRMREIVNEKCKE